MKKIIMLLTISIFTLSANAMVAPLYSSIADFKILTKIMDTVEFEDLVGVTGTVTGINLLSNGNYIIKTANCNLLVTKTTEQTNSKMAGEDFTLTLQPECI